MAGPELKHARPFVIGRDGASLADPRIKARFADLGGVPFPA